MGLFLQMAAVAATGDAVAGSIKRVAAEPVNSEIIAHQGDKALVIFNEYAEGISEICRKVSSDLRAPVFYLHIHDEDLWMHEFFVNGALADQFNTMPDYWGEISQEEKARWRGNAEVIGQLWPSVTADSIRRYLVNHSDGVIAKDAKAYPSDCCQYWDCWQITDFMEKLGVPYPENGVEVPVPSQWTGFRLTFDSVMMVGIACYAFYMSPKLARGLDIVALFHGGVLLATGVIAMISRPIERMVMVILSSTLVGFVAALCIIKGFNIKPIAVLIGACVMSAYYFVKWRKGFDD